MNTFAYGDTDLDCNLTPTCIMPIAVEVLSLKLRV